MLHKLVQKIKFVCMNGHVYYSNNFFMIKNSPCFLLFESIFSMVVFKQINC